LEYGPREILGISPWDPMLAASHIHTLKNQDNCRMLPVGK